MTFLVTMGGQINFFQEDIAAKIAGKKAIKSWIESVGVAEKAIFQGDLNIVFCSDEYLLGINKQYLSHDYYTDIITFGGSQKGEIGGEIYISLERVRENSKEYGIRYADELHRVIVHGVLHMIGYKDKSDKDVKQMRSKEDLYLSTRPKELIK